MKSFLTLINEYIANQKSERFGQFFCNRYLKTPWPELYYQENLHVASDYIMKWLTDHQYVEKLPQKVNGFEHELKGAE